MVNGAGECGKTVSQIVSAKKKKSVGCSGAVVRIPVRRMVALDLCAVKCSRQNKMEYAASR